MNYEFKKNKKARFGKPQDRHYYFSEELARPLKANANARGKQMRGAVAGR